MKKFLAILLTGAFVVGALSGCGSKSGGDDKVIKVAASATPHAGS